MIGKEHIQSTLCIPYGLGFGTDDIRSTGQDDAFRFVRHTNFSSSLVIVDNLPVFAKSRHQRYPNDVAMGSKTYRIEEAAKKLGVSARSVFRYIHDKKLRATKIGYWRITGEDLHVFIAGRANVRKPKKK